MHRSMHSALHNQIHNPGTHLYKCLWRLGTAAHRFANPDSCLDVFGQLHEPQWTNISLWRNIPIDFHNLFHVHIAELTLKVWPSCFLLTLKGGGGRGWARVQSQAASSFHRRVTFSMNGPDCAIQCSVTQLCPTFSNPVNCSPPRLHCPWNFPGKNTKLGCHFLLQLSSWPRDQTQVSCIFCIHRQILYHCATWED